MLKLGMFLSGLIMGSLLQADDGQAWPQFRGPDGQGHAGKTIREWTKDDYTWRVPIAPKGWSSPVMSEGIIVLTGSLEKGDTTELVVLARDQETGKELWQTSLFEPKEEELKARHRKNSLASCTPVIRDGVVYVHFGHMGTSAVELKTGKALWKTKVSYKPMHGGASSPILVNDLMVFSADGISKPTITALHTKTGKVAWKTPRSEKPQQRFSFATPLVVDDAGRQLIVSPASGMVGAYDPKSGKEIWKVRFKKGFSLVSRPVVMDKMVFMQTGYPRPNVLAIKLNGAKGDITDTNLVWKAKKGIPNTPSFIAHQGHLYVMDDTGRLSCLDGKDGKQLWRDKLPGNFSASPIFSDGYLYCLTEDGICYVVQVTPKGAKITFQTDFEERFFASPAVVNGALFLRSDSHLYRIEDK